MICVKCDKPNLQIGQDGIFKPAGLHPKIGIKMEDFICTDCSRAIDNTSREPGEDDEPIPATEW